MQARTKFQQNPIPVAELLMIQPISRPVFEDINFLIVLEIVWTELYQIWNHNEGHSSEHPKSVFDMLLRFET